MTTTRRELLGAGASAALGLLPWGNTAPVLAQASPARETPGAQTWEDGDLAHVLPTSSHDRILIKTSFKKPLDATPILQVGENRISGLRSDTCAYRKSNPDILLVQPAENWAAKNVPGPLDGARDRRILLP
jgi:hypothetical protein